ncbi:DNA mismatch endonuclease Vsr [Dokdonella fugitiva]|uniref:very short patch repair endonuclease n=1 Tax=Dokdonella fugitiva TaxID=328517 RepID=UPI001C71B461
MDKLTVERRSALMRSVRQKGSKPEIVVRILFHSLGARFRLHSIDLPGRPDIVLARHRLVVFVHGCFWHRHTGCSRASTPRSNVEFWAQKFSENDERDN